MEIKERMKRGWQAVRHFKPLKYIIVIAVGVVVVGFVDENSVWNHYRNKHRISELQSEIERYTRQHERNQAELHRLDTDPKAIEKIARERYFMKTDNEDIFVLRDEQPVEEAPEDEAVD